MQRPHLLLALAILGTIGCVHCPRDEYSNSLLEIEQTAVVAPARARVYTFLMNGMDLFELGGMSELREKLIAAGYPKIYYAQRADRAWYYREIHRLHRDDPDARFVLVSYGSAADQQMKLVHQLLDDGITLHGVVFLDPIGVVGQLNEWNQFPSLQIHSHHWRRAPHLQCTEGLELPGVGHLSLPQHPITVEKLTSLLTGIALSVPVAKPVGPCPPIGEKPNPIPRPDLPMRVRVAPPEWRFLCPADGSDVPNCLQGQSEPVAN
jgi:hypothetical protein